VVGLDWAFEIDDLLEITDCFEGQALGTVMKTLVQEYAARGGGVPDLFLWKKDNGECRGEVMFSEVKSENDRLSDTQRMWIDVLSGAGVRVELCHALADEVRERV
jgi:Fanconi-associated nuclease 1